MKIINFVLLSLIFTNVCFAQQQSSSGSTWVGATLLQNFDGEGTESLIGGGNVVLASSEELQGKFQLHIVGNISNLSKAVNQENIKTNLVRISQSTQGLSAGFEPIYTILKDDAKYIKTFNVYSHLLYKVNDFQKVNGTDDDVVLSQFRTTLGLEMEALTFNGSDHISISVEGIRTGFSGERYEKIFGEKKSSLYSVELIGIIPLLPRMGLLVGQTCTTGTKGVFSAGIVIKSKKE